MGYTSRDTQRLAGQQMSHGEGKGGGGGGRGEGGGRGGGRGVSGPHAVSFSGSI